MKTRKIIAFLSVFSLVFVLSLNLFAQKTMAAQAEKSYQGIILDYEELLTDAEEQEVSAQMSRLLEYGNVIFQSVKLENGQDFEKYSEQTYYDYFGNEPGVIFQVDMGHRKLTLSSSTGLDEIIGSERDSIIDNVYRYATDGDYCRCAVRCFDQIYDVINDGTIAHTMKYIDNALIAIIISLIMNFIVVFSSSKKKATVGQIVAAMAVTTAVADVAVKAGNVTKVYSPVSSGSGGSSGGGGFSGGGGGGFSGGSSSHGF